MSAEAGLPVVCSLSNYRACATKQLANDHIASLHMLAKQPMLFYGYWLTARRSCIEIQPHAVYAIDCEFLSREESSFP